MQRQSNCRGRIPVCPSPFADESFSSWVERTACFYGCDLEHWIGQFSLELPEYGAGYDLEPSDEVRAVLARWHRMPEHLLPMSVPSVDGCLPNGARSCFCEHCWDDDVEFGRQPYARRHWLKWTTVHCSIHATFLCTGNRSAGSGWQHIWTTKARWRKALGLPVRSHCKGLWSRVSDLVVAGCSIQDLRVLERFSSDSDDRLAKAALADVVSTWTSQETAGGWSRQPPVLLQNRIEVLQQAASRLKQSINSSHQSRD